MLKNLSKATILAVMSIVLGLFILMIIAIPLLIPDNTPPTPTVYKEREFIWRADAQIGPMRYTMDEIAELIINPDTAEYSEQLLLELLAHLYTEDDREAVNRILEPINHWDWRILIAAVHRSSVRSNYQSGNLDSLQNQVDTAYTDYRDLLGQYYQDAR